MARSRPIRKAGKRLIGDVSAAPAPKKTKTGSSQQSQSATQAATQHDDHNDNDDLEIWEDDYSATRGSHNES